MDHVQAAAAAAARHCSTLCHQTGGFQFNEQNGWAGWAALFGLIFFAAVAVGVGAMIHVSIGHRVRMRREAETRGLPTRQRASARR